MHILRMYTGAGANRRFLIGAMVDAVFTGTARAPTCGGRLVLAPTISWRSLDSAIVRAEAHTGRITARAARTIQRIATSGLGSAISTVCVIVR